MGNDEENKLLEEQTEEEQQERSYYSSLIAFADTKVVNVALSKEELITLTSLLGLSAKTFENLALQAAQQNDEETFKVLSARHKLSNHFVSKLIEFYKMPEPISKEYH